MLSYLTGNQQNGLANVTHLVIDEVHELDVKTDFLLRVIKQMLPENTKLKFILMSATLDTDLFSGYFDDCQTIKMAGRTYDVDELYLSDILIKTKYVQHGNPDNATTEEAISILEESYGKSIEYTDHNDLAACLIHHLHVSTPKEEGILVFLPGADSIRMLKDVIKDKTSITIEDMVC